MNRVVVFGIDGGSLKLIEQWQDELPNLKRIMQGGVYGELESTIPSVTCPAWPCMFTGKNPAKIGMYSFISVEAGGEYRTRIHSSREYHQWSLWKMLNDYGIAVGLLNVPMTFPPHKVANFMVCGMGSPVGGRVNYTYPDWLKNELNKAVPGYQVLPPIFLTVHGKEKEHNSVLEQEVRHRLQAAKYLLNTFPWQFFTMVFSAVDGAQHYFWHHMDESHPRHDSNKYRDVIKNLYKMIDSAIGELLKELPAETNIFIVSDHGFGPCYGNFLVNKWLEKQGLLTYLPTIAEKTKTPWLWRIRDFLLSVLGNRVTSTIAKIIPEWLSMKLAKRRQRVHELVRIYRNIDWSRTKAYPEGSTRMICINLKGREPTGIVEPGDEYEKLVAEIITRLNKTIDPKTGEPVGITAFRKSEIYQGKYDTLAPDIVFIMDKYTLAVGRNAQSEWRERVWSGCHARQGVFLAYGPDIKDKGERLPNLKIYDITPTVLHIFGLPVPKDADGRVLTQIFQSGSEPATREVAYEKTDAKTREKIKELKNSGKV